MVGKDPVPLAPKEQMDLHRRFGWSRDGRGQLSAALRAPVEAFRSWAFDSSDATMRAYNLDIPGCRPNVDYNPQSRAVVNDCRDAFRHAYWNALMAQRDEGKAAMLADAYERANPNDYKEHFMDLYNNRKGRRIGAANRLATPAELSDAVARALANGELISNIDKMAPFVNALQRRRMRTRP